VYKKRKYMLTNIILNNSNTEIDNNILVIPSLAGKDFIRLDTIVHCQASDAYCIIFLNNGNKHTICKTLKTIEKKLPAHKFIKTHQSHIVNIAFINRYITGEENFVVMHDGKHIPIARSQKKTFKALINMLQIF
jgi:two-component system, LytTR family, response regulator